MILPRLLLGVLITGLLGCNYSFNARKAYASNILLTDRFLIRQWMLDSISGSNSFVQDWVYITPDRKFWRLSYYNNSYVIDSALEYNNGKVFQNGNLKYNMYANDSTNLRLVTPTDSVLYLRAWGSYDKEDIDRLGRNNPKKLLLNGIWKLDSAGYLPAYLPSYCDNLYPGSRLNFREDGVLDVYPKDSIQKCYGYSYKVFDDDIALQESDMIVSLKLVKLTSDSLVVNSRWLNTGNPKWTTEVWKVRDSGYNIYLTKTKK